MRRLIARVSSLARSGALAPLVALAAGAAVTYLVGAVKTLEDEAERLTALIEERRAELDQVNKTYFEIDSPGDRVDQGDAVDEPGDEPDPVDQLPTKVLITADDWAAAAGAR
jgi:hypothetical protein